MSKAITKATLDMGALKKGDVLTTDQLEGIFGLSSQLDVEAFKLKMMALGQDIERQRPGLLCRGDHMTIRIMVDDEAEQVTWTRCVQAIGRIQRNTDRRATIDRSEFSDEEKRISDARDGCLSHVALAAQRQLQAAKREQLLMAAARGDEVES